MSDRSIADYGLLSDCHSAALVSGEGSIDWLCFPRFDSPSVFARLLDPDAGHWSITPAGEFDVRRRYLPGTLVIETQFATAGGMVMITDALVFDRDERGHEIGDNAPHVLVRVAEVTEGTVELEADYRPRPEYGLVSPRLEIIDGVVLSRGGAEVLCLAGPPPTELADAGARWRMTLSKGDRVAFALHHAQRWAALPETWSEKQINKRLADTVAGWESWSKLHQRYQGPAEELVHLSGRVLRGLTYQPTGAIVAAPTTSLPEKVGGARNWDYRYCWLRDASFTLDALWVAACPDEAGDFVRWIIETAGTSLSQESGLQIMYGVGGEHDLSERELPHLAGWRASRPVRVGNGAWNQTQIDIYGELPCSASRTRSATYPRPPASSWPTWPTPPPRPGAAPTRAFGRVGASSATTSIPSSCAGSPSIGPWPWPSGSGGPTRSTTGRPAGRRCAPPSWPTAGARSSAPTPRVSARTSSTPRR